LPWSPGLSFLGDHERLRTVLITGTNRVSASVLPSSSRGGAGAYSRLPASGRGKGTACIRRGIKDRVEVLPVEVRDDASVAALGRRLRRGPGRSDMLVNNAGILRGTIAREPAI